MIKCTNGHELADDQKFCGECGQPPVKDGGEKQMVKCSDCETEVPADQKFCGNCGQPMTKAQDTAWEAAMSELRDLAKAREDLPSEIEVSAGSHDTDSAVDAALQASVDAEDQLAKAILEATGALIKSNNLAVDRGTAVAREARDMNRALGQFAKAIDAGLSSIRSAVNDRVAGLEQKFDEWANKPGQVRSRLSVVGAMNKATPGVENDPSDTSLKGDALVKAAVDLENDGKLNPGDATLTQFYTNRGATLKALSEFDPGLANRINAALPAGQNTQQ